MTSLTYVSISGYRTCSLVTIPKEASRTRSLQSSGGLKKWEDTASHHHIPVRESCQAGSEPSTSLATVHAQDTVHLATLLCSLQLGTCMDLS